MLTVVQCARGIIVSALQNGRQLLVADGLLDGLAAEGCRAVRTLVLAAAEAHAAAASGNGAAAGQTVLVMQSRSDPVRLKLTM